MRTGRQRSPPAIGNHRFAEVAPAISPLVEKGFGESESDAILRLFASAAVKNTGTKTFPIAYRGKDTAMRVELKKDDVAEIEIWFFTEPELAKEIQAKMRE